MKNFIRIAALCFMVVPSVVNAQDYKKGSDAFISGDYAAAFSEFKPLAEQGNAFAQFGLGYMYDTGQGVPQDHTEAVKWFWKAADQNVVGAQVSLGFMYAHGRGIPQDYSEAVRWFTKAAEQGDVEAQFSLGVMYSNGEGVPQDYITAHMWYNLAAASGDERPVKNRDLVASNMTPADVSEAQRRARVCMSSGYTDCD